MSDNSVRLQITLRRSIPAEKAILEMLDGAGAGVARQHLLRDILTRGIQSFMAPAAAPVVAAPVASVPPRPASTPVLAVQPIPSAPAVSPAVKSKKPLAELM